MSAPNLINLYAYCRDRVLDPVTRAPITEARLAEVLPESLAAMELAEQTHVAIPEELHSVFAEFRPTPIIDAKRFADAIGGGCQILVKDEGSSPSGNHKMNSAMWIAYHAARDGVRTLITETTGNWGHALAIAGARFGVRVVCFIDEKSVSARPDRVALMTEAGAEVIVVGAEGEDYDPLVLSADRAVSYARSREDSRYIFGSVYNYFILPQTIAGVEVRQVLEQTPPDIVVGSCGGGANLLGISAAYLVDRVAGDGGPEVVCAESSLCPIVSKGIPGEYSIDNQQFYPLLKTYGLDRLLGDTYIGGLGSTIVAAPVAAFHEEGLIRTRSFTDQEALDAAELFQKTEGRRVALETGYQLAGVIAEARRRPGARILVNISSVRANSFA
ncbi:pyridoxal-phosphate dependent enzyme [Kitasatospora griseola]|uniref:pyridoxal-phosphate dependent enzyme n=1 Tax=Kitasatospora griseola TaxID=2064 RepID=UPI00343C6850